MRHVMIHLTPEERGTAVITKNVMSNWIGLLMDKYDERKRLRQLAPIQPDDEDDSYNESIDNDTDTMVCSLLLQTNTFCHCFYCEF